MTPITNPLEIGLLVVVPVVVLAYSFYKTVREEKRARLTEHPDLRRHRLKRENRGTAFLLGLLAIGAFYIFFPEQARYVTTGVVGVGAAYFVGLPLLLAWAWPVIAIVGLFVLANALFPSKRA